MPTKFQPRRIKYRELVKILKPLGIKVMVKRGKGSERMLFQEKTGLNYPVAYHGSNQEYAKAVVRAIQRKFSIPDKTMFS